MKDFAKVVQYSREALAISLPDKQFFIHYLGVAAYELKEYQKAVPYFYQVIEIDPQHTDAFYYLGLCLNALGQEEKGKAVLRQAAILYQTEGPSIKEDELNVRVF